jgi:hypothetical protein
MNMLEIGLWLDKAYNIGIFTELAIVYSKYNPKGLKKFVRSYHGVFNKRKVARACEAAHLWKMAFFLHKRLMLKPDFSEHVIKKEIIMKRADENVVEADPQEVLLQSSRYFNSNSS